MGYSFYIVDIDPKKKINFVDYELALSKLSSFNLTGLAGGKTCDVKYYDGTIRVSGAFGISGQYAEGFVLNVVINLIKEGVIPTVLSNDFGYGAKEDFIKYNLI
jgi:hypothetical protein